MSGIIKSLEFNPLNKRYGVVVFTCVTPYNEEYQAKTLRQAVLPESRVKDKDSDMNLILNDGKSAKLLANQQFAKLCSKGKSLKLKEINVVCVKTPQENNYVA
ncbi:MAG: hypothetical protein EZS28_054313 [Streblomastix strix]|uniref:Uncharacterized protein n=1 Tax=Streblomastix strix TaxID=222440 RepID=A0A5J4QR15_9EUKA|nr:MAG: hypothetical protein EZS28_054313 [Streblomastix strix]